MEVSKTICPVQDYVHAEAADAATTENLFLEVATASDLDVGFSLVLRQERVSMGYVRFLLFVCAGGGHGLLALCGGCIVIVSGSLCRILHNFV